MRLVFDIETNGLELHEITKIHCICISDLDDDMKYSFVAEDNQHLIDHIEEGVKMLNSASEIIGHNIISYDIPVIQKFFREFKPKKITDTLVLARLFEPDRKVHSLGSYGNSVGTQKVKHEDWSVFSPEMLDRCKTDVDINVKLYRYFMALKQDHPHWNFAIQLEHQVAKIMAEQAANGWLFDTEKAKKLVEKLDNDIQQIDKQLEHLLHKRVVKISEVKKPFKKNGQLTEQCKKYIDFPIPISAIAYPLGQFLEVVGPFSVIEFQGINLGSEKQMKELLLSLGWKPTQWNYRKDEKGKILKDAKGDPIKTSPKLTEDSYDSLPEGVGQLLAKRLKSEHRRNQIQGLIENVRSDGRISAKANPCGANTARMYHQIVVNIPKAKDNVFLGKEMRSLFIAPENKVLVGCDASALEARCLAHYVNDPSFTKEVLENDIHTVMQSLSGLPTRDQAKTLTYALMYGAGDAKLGKIVNGTAKDGAWLRQQLYLKSPNLGKLIENVKKASRKGWIKAIDGRKLFIRSEHSALNVLLQGCGAIVMKMAMCVLHREIQREKLNVKQVGCFHDEFQFECDVKYAEKFANLAKYAIIQAGKYFKMRCELNAESKQGINWAETH